MWMYKTRKIFWMFYLYVLYKLNFMVGSTYIRIRFGHILQKRRIHTWTINIFSQR